MKFARQYHTDEGWTDVDVFDNSADLWMEVQQMWNCEEFSNELQDWCDNGKVGDVFEDEDIRVTICE